MMKVVFELSSSRSSSGEKNAILFMGSTLSANLGLDAIEILNRCVSICISLTETSDDQDVSFGLNSARTQTISNVKKNMFELAMLLSHATFEQFIFLVAISAKSFLEILCKILEQCKFFTSK